MADVKGFGDYLKAAFLQHWNLLYLFGAAGLAILSLATGTSFWRWAAPAN